MRILFVTHGNIYIIIITILVCITFKFIVYKLLIHLSKVIRFFFQLFML